MVGIVINIATCIMIVLTIISVIIAFILLFKRGIITDEKQNNIQQDMAEGKWFINHLEDGHFKRLDMIYGDNSFDERKFVSRPISPTVTSKIMEIKLSNSENPFLPDWR